MSGYSSHNILRRAGFTLIELLMAMIVSSIILGAVATLASAFSYAKSGADDQSHNQTILRYTTMRLSDLIKHGNIAYPISAGSIAIWADADTDGLINGSELVYIQSSAHTQAEGDPYFTLELLEFPSQTDAINGVSIQAGTAETWLINSSVERRTVLLPECQNIVFNISNDNRLVSILFTLTENGFTNTHQVTAALRGSQDQLNNGDEI